MAKYPRGNPAKWWRSRSVGSAHRSPAAMFISPFRRFTSLILLLTLVTLIGSVWYVARPDRLSRMAQLLLSQVLGGDAEVGGAHLSFAGTLELSGVRLRARGGETLFSADELRMRFDWLSLVTGQLEATQITAVRATLNLVEDRDKRTWNYEGLGAKVAEGGGNAGTQPSGGGGGGGAVGGGGRGMALPAIPVIILREARVQFAEVGGGSYQRTAEAVVDAQLTPDSAAPRVYQITVSQHRDPGEVETADAAIPGQVHGTWDVAGNRFSATATEVLLTDRLQHSLPRQVREWWQSHQPSGRLEELRLAFDPEGGLVVDVRLAGVSFQQRLEEFGPAMPAGVVVPVEDVRGSLRFGIKGGQIEIRDLRANMLTFEIFARGRFDGTGPDSPFLLNLEIPKLHLDDPYPDVLYKIDQTRDVIAGMHPRGMAALKVVVKRVAGDPYVAVDGEVECQNLQARYAHFPYPCHDVRGKVTFTNKEVVFHHLRGMADESAVEVNGLSGIIREWRPLDITVTSSPVRPDGSPADGTIVLDERLTQCMPTNFREVWRQFEPRGRARFRVRVTRENRPDAKEDIVVVMEPADVTARYEKFPYPLQHIDTGRITIDGDQTTVEHLRAKTGPDASGELEIDGVVRYAGGNMDSVKPELKIIGKNMPIERALLEALPEDHQAWTRQVELAGRANIDGVLSRAAPTDGKPGAKEGGGLQMTGKLTLTDAQGQSRTKKEGFPLWTLRDLALSLDIAPDLFTIEKLTATAGVQGKCRVDITGTIDRRTDQMKLAAGGTWKDLDVPAKAPALIPATFAKVWNKYRPSGPMDGAFDLKMEVEQGALGAITGQDEPPPTTAPATQGAPEDAGSEALATMPATSAPATRFAQLAAGGGPKGEGRGEKGDDAATRRRPPSGDAANESMGGTTMPQSPTSQPGGLAGMIKDYHVTLKPKGMKLAPEGWPDVITDIAADRIALDTDAITLDHLQARSDPLVLSGSGRYDRKRETLLLTAVKLSAEKLPTKWLALLPGSVGDFLRSTNPEGKLAVDLKEVTRTSEKGQTRWAFDGSVRFDDLHTTKLIPASIESLAVAGKGMWDTTAAGGGLALDDGTINATNVTLSGRVIESFTGKMSADAEKKQIQLTDLDGKVGGGVLQGKILINLGATPSYQGTLVLNDAELALLALPASASVEDRKKVGTGRLTANLAVQQVFGDEGTRTGRGEMVVKGGTIYDVPLAMGLMQVATLRLPVSGAFNDASMSYYIRDNKITFEKILLESPGINLAGAGTLSLADRGLDLRFVTESPGAFRIEALDWMRNQLFQLQISGVLESPKVTPVPLDALSATLQALLPKPVKGKGS